MMADFVGSLSHILGPKQKYSLFPHQDVIPGMIEKACKHYETYCCKCKLLEIEQHEYEHICIQLCLFGQGESHNVSSKWFS